jgi:hypothetical protein
MIDRFPSVHQLGIQGYRSHLLILCTQEGLAP